MWKKNKLLLIVNGFLVELPSPSNLSYFWNFGSLLGIFLLIQVGSGLFLSFHFSGDVNLSFYRVIHIIRDVNYGWFLRIIHANGARMFFLLIYIHIGRGIYYGSYRLIEVWLRGVRIFLLSMATAFLGYVLPWGQISFWAATVITNLLSAVPYFGFILVEWVWGGFAVGNSTLIRFFAFHFVLPFIIIVFILLHLFFLHEKGSSNPLGLNRSFDKIFFYPYYVYKDIFGLVFFVIFFTLICILFPYIFMDVENFIPSNPIITPVHIQPEWYFLFAYAILRSVPRKIGGVVALLISVVVLYLLPFFIKHRFRGTFFYNLIKFVFWIYVINWILLSWIGACVVEYPYIVMGVYFRIFYFLLYFVFWMVCGIQDFFIWLYYNCFESNF